MQLKAKAKRPTIGELVDDAMTAIERENPTLKGVLPKDFARPALDKQRLGQLIDLVSNIKVGDAEARSKDVLGRVYEYFLSQFASAEGKKGGEFYTPRCVVKLLVEMLEPYQGRVYDPCCGSSGMFVQSMEFIRAHANGNGGAREGKSREGRHPDPRAGVQLHHLAPREDEPRDPRDQRADRARRYAPERPLPGSQGGLHPCQSALQHLRLGRRPAEGRQAVGRTACRPRATRTSPGSSTWSNTSPLEGVAGIRARKRVDVVEPVGRRVRSGGSWSKADLVDCMVALCQDSSSTRPRSRPACGSSHAIEPGARSALGLGRSCSSTPGKIGRMVDRTHREFTDEDIARITNTYRAWRGGDDAGGYVDERGYCKSATIDDVRKYGHVLTPGRYVGAAPEEEEKQPFDEKMKQLVSTLSEQQAEGARLDVAITKNLQALGFGNNA